MEPTAIAVVAGFIIDHLPPQVKANIVDAVTSAITGTVGPMTAPLRAWFDGQARITSAKADAQVAIINGLSEAAAVAAASDPELVSRALTQFGGRLVREQENREAIIGETAKLLRTTPPKVDAGSSIDEDWLYTFWRLAETKTNRDIQVIFGSILAGEVANPGTFSPGTLALLATLTPDVAQRFARFARLTMLGEGDASVIHPNVFSFQNIGPLVLQLQFIADGRGSAHGGHALGGRVAIGRWRRCARDRGALGDRRGA